MSLLLIGVASTRSNVPVVRSLKSAMPEIRKTNKKTKKLIRIGNILSK